MQKLKNRIKELLDKYLSLIIFWAIPIAVYLVSSSFIIALISWFVLFILLFVINTWLMREVPDTDLIADHLKRDYLDG